MVRNMALTNNYQFFRNTILLTIRKERLSIACVNKHMINSEFNSEKEFNSLRTSVAKNRLAN